MLYSPRPFARLLIVFTILVAASLSIAAQEIRDRQLVPAVDFSTIQMPVEIVSIKLNGEDIQPGQNIKGNDDWLKGLSFTLKNISDRPIAWVNIGFKFGLPNGFVVYSLPYGIALFRGDWRREGYSPPPLQPGESVTLALTGRNYQSFLYVLEQANAPRSFDKAPFYIETVCFEDEPDVIWQGGYLKRRDPKDQFKFDVIERYVLPAKQR